MTLEEKVELLERQVEFLSKAVAELQERPRYDPDTLAWRTGADPTWKWDYDRKTRTWIRPEYPTAVEPD